MTSKDVKIHPTVLDVDNSGTPELTTLCRDEQAATQAPATKASSVSGSDPIKLQDQKLSKKSKVIASSA